MKVVYLGIDLFIWGWESNWYSFVVSRNKFTLCYFEYSFSVLFLVFFSSLYTKKEKRVDKTFCVLYNRHFLYFLVLNTLHTVRKPIIFRPISKQLLQAWIQRLLNKCQVLSMLVPSRYCERPLPCNEPVVGGFKMTMTIFICFTIIKYIGRFIFVFRNLTAACFSQLQYYQYKR